MKSYVYRVTPILDGAENEIYRDILIQEDKSLEDFHFAILDAYGLQEGEMASFYTCTENWEEGLEITLMDMGTMEHESVSILMQELSIKNSVSKDVKYYKFTYDFLFPKKFKIERIGENTEIKENVPVLLAEVGTYEPVVNHLSDLTFDDFEEDSISDDDDDEPTFENIDDLDI
jgi:hypothetical protein